MGFPPRGHTGMWAYVYITSNSQRVHRETRKSEGGTRNSGQDRVGKACVLARTLSTQDRIEFWLEPIVLSRSVGYNSAELTRLRQLVEKHRELLLEKWHEHFS
jgi:hypothetical protein